MIFLKRVQREVTDPDGIHAVHAWLPVRGFHRGDDAVVRLYVDAPLVPQVVAQRVRRGHGGHERAHLLRPQEGRQENRRRAGVDLVAELLELLGPEAAAGWGAAEGRGPRRRGGRQDDEHLGQVLLADGLVSGEVPDLDLEVRLLQRRPQRRQGPRRDRRRGHHPLHLRGNLRFVVGQQDACGEFSVRQAEDSRSDGRVAAEVPLLALVVRSGGPSGARSRSPYLVKPDDLGLGFRLDDDDVVFGDVRGQFGVLQLRELLRLVDQAAKRRQEGCEELAVGRLRYHLLTRRVGGGEFLDTAAGGLADLADHLDHLGDFRTQAPDRLFQEVRLGDLRDGLGVRGQFLQHRSQRLVEQRDQVDPPHSHLGGHLRAEVATVPHEFRMILAADGLEHPGGGADLSRSLPHAGDERLDRRGRVVREGSARGAERLGHVLGGLDTVVQAGHRRLEAGLVGQRSQQFADRPHALILRLQRIVDGRQDFCQVADQRGVVRQPRALERALRLLEDPGEFLPGLCENVARLGGHAPGGQVRFALQRCPAGGLGLQAGHQLLALREALPEERRMIARLSAKLRTQALDEGVLLRVVRDDDDLDLVAAFAHLLQQFDDARGILRAQLLLVFGRVYAGQGYVLLQTVQDLARPLAQSVDAQRLHRVAVVVGLGDHVDRDGQRQRGADGDRHDRSVPQARPRRGSEVQQRRGAAGPHEHGQRHEQQGDVVLRPEAGYAPQGPAQRGQCSRHGGHRPEAQEEPLAPDASAQQLQADGQQDAAEHNPPDLVGQHSGGLAPVDP